MMDGQHQAPSTYVISPTIMIPPDREPGEWRDRANRAEGELLGIQREIFEADIRVTFGRRKPPPEEGPDAPT